MSDRKIKVGGVYRHFKGGTYRVVLTAKDSEASKEGREESVVVYECMSGRGYFVRPFSIFLGTVDCDSKIMQRFAEVEETG